jgi:small-conductance mechanosensitive channel
MRDLFANPAALLTAGLVAGTVFLLLAATRTLLRRRLREWRKSETEFDDFFFDLAGHTKLWLLVLPALFLGARLLKVPGDMPAELYKPLRLAAHVSFIAQLAFWASGIADFWLRRRRAGLAPDPSAQMTVNIFRVTIVGAVWIVAGLVALENIGFNVSTIIAGLGIGGIAVALALQNILGDLFASLSIVVDKPFVLGDTIGVDTFTGTVEHVGLKTTRLRSVTGEELIFSNGDLLKSRVRNYKRMTERRGTLRLTLAHGTDPDKLERVPLMMQAAIEKHDQTRFDRAHITAVTDLGIETEAIYALTTAEYRVYADTQQAVLLDVLRAFSAEGIGLAHRDTH